ncbi:MAG: hypothetical protein NVS9B4_00820 [Candidatus Acidiferrum sp.]
MDFNAQLGFDTTLTGVLIRPDGSRQQVVHSTERLFKPLSFWKRLYNKLRGEVPFIAAMSFAGFIAWATNTKEGASCALVTTAGMTYLMTCFSSNTNPIVNYKFHDCGTGVVAAAIGDTALGTAAGSARVAGTQVATSALVYTSVATIVPGGTLAITEWGVFSASTVGTLWDRRVFSAINVVAADSIQFTYSLTGAAGGS